MEEGSRYVFGEVSIATTLKKLNAESLRGDLTAVSGEVFNSLAIEDSRVALTFALGRLGYAFVDVRPRINRDRKNLKINVAYEIKEGPRVYVL